MNSKKIAATIGAGVAGVALTGVAVASWGTSQQASSSGNNNGAHGSAATLGVSVDASALTGLYPTWTGTKNVTVTVTNPNPYKVVIDTVTGVAASSTGTCGTDLAALPSSPYTFGAATSGLGSVIQAKPQTGASTATVTIPLTAVSNALPDSCQNAPVVVTATANVSSN